MVAMSTWRDSVAWGIFIRTQIVNGSAQSLKGESQWNKSYTGSSTKCDLATGRAESAKGWALMMELDKETVKRFWTAVMLLLLVVTAPQWMQPGAAKISAYEAPWVYPGLMPPQ
jgi:hypothetical protein